MSETAKLLAMILSDEALSLSLSSPNSQNPGQLLPNLRELRIFRMIPKPGYAVRAAHVEHPFAQLLPQLWELVTRRGYRSHVGKGSDHRREMQALRKLVLVLPEGTIDSAQRAWFSDQVPDIDITCMDWTGCSVDDEVMETNAW